MPLVHAHPHFGGEYFDLIIEPLGNLGATLWSGATIEFTTNIVFKKTFDGAVKLKIFRILPLPGASIFDEYLVPPGTHYSGERILGNYTLTVPTDLQPGEGVTLTIYTVDSPVELEYGPIFLQTIQPEAPRSPLVEWWIPLFIGVAIGVAATMLVAKVKR